MRRILPATLSLLLCVSSAAWSDTGSPSIDDSSRAAATPAAGLSAAMPIADQIIVRKSQRRLYLMRRGEVLRSYRVALGLMPEGAKERAGDFRTPEGHYQLTRRNPRSDYFLSIQVSYPNDQDLRRAHHQHVEAGRRDHAARSAEQPATPARVLCQGRLDRWLHRHVRFRYGGAVDDDPGQHPDRNPALRTVPVPEPAGALEASIVVADSVDARVGPRGSLENLSQAEIDKLLDTSQTGLYTLFRNCALAVLNSGSDNDNAKEIFERYRNFDVQIVRHAWGIKLQISNAPPAAFVDGEMIRGIKEHLFAVLRDVIYTANEIIGVGRLDTHDPRLDHQCRIPYPAQRQGARLQGQPNLVVCWGGHSIGEPNTSTPSASAMSWGCGHSMSARAAGLGP
jgi:hypothetical protein